MTLNDIKKEIEKEEREHLIECSCGIPTYLNELKAKFEGYKLAQKEILDNIKERLREWELDRKKIIEGKYENLLFGKSEDYSICQIVEQELKELVSQSSPNKNNSQDAFKGNYKGAGTSLNNLNQAKVQHPDTSFDIPKENLQ